MLISNNKKVMGNAVNGQLTNIVSLGDYANNVCSPNRYARTLKINRLLH